jgi:hypothetical protein
MVGGAGCEAQVKEGMRVNQATARAWKSRRGTGRVVGNKSVLFANRKKHNASFVDGGWRRDANAMDSHVALGEILARMRMARGLLLAGCEFHQRSATPSQVRKRSARDTTHVRCCLPKLNYTRSPRASYVCTVLLSMFTARSQLSYTSIYT